jgi:hypothetical protein
VRGDVGLFQKTIAGQAFLPRVRCPILYLSSTNDFNAPMDFVEKGMSLVSHDKHRTVYAPHLNHRFTPESEIARPLWFDAHFQQRLKFPKSPTAELILDTPSGVPLFQVKPDASRAIERINVYYGYERDPRNRFWADGQAKERNGVWEAPCPVFDLDEPLFVLANVHYELAEHERREGDPAHFILSTALSAYPEDLRRAKVQATARRSRLIDDFARGFHDWYALNARNPHHWLFATRKLADPRWEAPRDAMLTFRIQTAQPGNILAVQLRTDDWRGYTGRRKDTWTAFVPLGDKTGDIPVELAAADFKNQTGQPLADWYGITELLLLSADKIKLPSAKKFQHWRGGVPQFGNLRWEGGDPVRRPKPFLPRQ